jgi:DNA repair exonuclease SbcCD ATPase subunit
MTSPRLLWVELEAFRGAAETIRVDLDADCVLIRGDNGFGKTTIVDGLLWLVCGELRHLAERTKGMRRAEDAIVNRYSGGAVARVRLAIGLNGDVWEFERKGRANGSILTSWKAGVELSDPEGDSQLASLFGDFNPASLSNAVATWGVLRQDAVRAALEGGAAMHDRLAAVVGLERVSLFADSAGRVAKDLSQQRKRLKAMCSEARSKSVQAAEALNESRNQAGAAPAAQGVLQSQLTRITASLPDGLAVHVDADFAVEGLLRLGTHVGSLIAAVSRLLDADHEVRQLDQARGQSLAELEASLAVAQQGAQDLVLRSPLREQLATTALQLMGPVCPVCEQPINEESVRRHLEEVLSSANADGHAASAAQQAVADAQAKVTDAQAVEARRALATGRLESAASALADVASQGDSVFHVGHEWMNASQWESLLAALNELRGELRQFELALKQTAGDRLAEAEAAAESASSYLSQVTSEYEELQARTMRAESLDTAAHAAAQRIVERALDLISPSFAEVFDRLAPHPTFTQLRARQDFFYGRNQVVPEVYDPGRRIAANPFLVYSEGQLNVVALSYFLGLALNSREGSLPFMVLDDPLQAMDVLSVLGFADLCRRIREQRQLIVTTHDRRFAELLLRKLAPRQGTERTVVVEFEGWSREGPRIKTSDVPLADVLPILGQWGA